MTIVLESLNCATVFLIRFPDFINVILGLTSKTTFNTDQLLGKMGLGGLETVFETGVYMG